jgi:Ca2+-binding EF-hand superfamily protein
VLKVLLKSLGIVHLFPQALIKAMFHEIDTDANGLLDYEELSTFLDAEAQHQATKKQHLARGDAHLVHMHNYNRRTFA